MSHIRSHIIGYNPNPQFKRSLSSVMIKDVIDGQQVEAVISIVPKDEVSFNVFQDGNSDDFFSFLELCPEINTVSDISSEIQYLVKNSLSSHIPGTHNHSGCN